MNPMDALTRKFFGVPAWVYGGVAVAVIWAVWYWKQRSGLVTGEDDAASLGEELGLGSGSLDLSGHLEDTGLDNPTPGTGTGGTNTVPDGKPTTNAQWFSASFEYLTTTYGLGETEVTTALRDYLQGKAPSGNGWAWVMLCLGKFGNPPEGRITPPATPETPTPPGEGPPGQSVPPPPVGTYIPVPLNTNLYDMCLGISKGYGIPYDLNIMRNLNPGIDKKITWIEAGANDIPVFKGPIGPIRIR